jgi:protein TIF31
MLANPLQCSVSVAAILSALVSVGSGGERRDAPAAAYNPAGGSAVPGQAPDYEEVWAEIRADMGRRFRYELGATPAMNRRAIPLLRRVCQRSGIRLDANCDYDFDGDAGKCKAGDNFPISAADLYEIVPMVKHTASARQPFLPAFVGGEAGLAPSGLGWSSGCRSTVVFPEVRNSVEIATQLLRQGRFKEAYQRAEQGIALLGDIVGNIHADLVQCFEIQAVVLFQLKEVHTAIQFSSKALTVAAQIYGIDSPKLVQRHLELSRLLAATGQVDSALLHLELASNVLETCSGPNHPESVDIHLR